MIAWDNDWLLVEVNCTKKFFGSIILGQTGKNWVWDYVSCCFLKLVCAVFYQIVIFPQIIALQKLWKMFFISPKKFFSFSRYSKFCIFVFPSFFPVSHCFRGWFEKNLKVYDVINCLNEKLITHFAWYLEKEIRCDIETLSIERVLNKEHFYGKIMQKMCTKS